MWLDDGQFRNKSHSTKLVLIVSVSNVLINAYDIDSETRMPGTDYTIRNYKVENDRNVLLEHVLSKWGYPKELLKNHGHWCPALYGALSNTPHGHAIDDFDRVCKHWRQQTRCLFETDLCFTGMDFYTLNTYDNNGIGFNFFYF